MEINILDQLTDQERQLFLLLDKSRDSRYYSYSLKSILNTLQINREKLVKLGHNLEIKLGNDYHINLFDWNDKSGKVYTFIGFEYRRRDYEKDKILGINVVEDYIKNGVYSK